METETDIKKKSTNFYLIPLAILLTGAIIGGSVLLKAKFSTKNITSIADQPYSQPIVGSYAPLFLLKTSKGIEISLNDLRGQNILLVFWSTNCQYSAKELEDLKKFTDAYQGKISVVAVIYKDPPQLVDEYQKKENINFTMLLDQDGKVTEKYRVDGTPWHFFIDRQGKITASLPDYNPYENLIIYAREMFGPN